MHTDMPTRPTVERLLTARDDASVSIYVPTSPLTQEAQASRIELKNLAGDAIRQLEDARADRRGIEEIRDALDELVDDEDFWSEQARSLAVFASPEGVRTFRLPSRLPQVVEVADRFYVKPLLRATTFPQAAFVLALAAGSVRLVEVLRDGPPFVVNVPGLPKDAPSSDRKESTPRLRQYARKVEQALRGVVTGLELPLILAATRPLDSIYRSVNTYPGLIEPGIRRSPEDATDDELADAARTLLDELYASELAEVRARFDQRAAQERASTDVAEVARAATHGAVDTLLVDIDEKLPGMVDEGSGAVTLAADDATSYGVVDEIAKRVLLTGGRVLAVRAPDLPGDGEVAAILRYPL
jgi:hypothetical protein